MADIKETLRLHALWLAGHERGVRAEAIQIGCQRKSIGEWFSLDSISNHEYYDSQWLAFKPLIKQIIEQYPATLTGKENQNG